MLTLHANKATRTCGGWRRRDFLTLGGLGCGAGALFPQSLWAEPAGRAAEKSVVMIYLPGGPTQFETFDPKPDAPSEIRGSFVPTSTSVPGVHFCELTPRLAASLDRFSIVRTLTGMVNRHESFHCYTGRPGGRPEDREPDGGWPSFGSFVSRILGPNPRGVIPYVDAAPKMSYPPYNNAGLHDAFATRSWPGFTGRQHAPFTLEGEVRDDLQLQGIDRERLNRRRGLLASVASRSLGWNTELDVLNEQALGLLTSSALAEALDLEREDPAVRELYGEAQATDPSFGGAPQSPQHLLLARRLVEAGVRCVTVAFGAWDWHANREGPIEQLSRKYLPVFDRALAVFLQDLEQRGLLEHVAVVVLGEFGRTPRINAKGGRDHWPNTQSIVLAGGGIRGGCVLGETDRIGGEPVERPVHLQEVFATLYHTLGIDVNTTKVADLQGRPRYLVDENRQPIRELL